MAYIVHQNIGAAGPTSQTWTTPWPHKLGDKARDKDGNEYVFCQCITTNVSGGILCSINDVYQAAPLLGTALLPSRVGVAMTGMTATTDAGWFQIYGLCAGVQTAGASDGLVSDQTVEYVLTPQGSVGTPSGTLTLFAAATTDAQNQIYGMWLSAMGTVSNLTTNKDFVIQGSAVSGPSTDVTATTNGTSMHIGQTYVCFLNYPYVTGVKSKQDASQS